MSTNINARWRTYSDAFYALPRGRRAFWIGLIGLAFTFLLVNQWLLPNWQALQLTQQQQQQANRDLTQTVALVGQTQQALMGDPNAALRRQVEFAEQRLTQLQQRIQAQTAYVSARDNRALLEALLGAATEVEVMTAEALAAQPLVLEPNASEPGAGSGIFQHVLRVVIRGDYAAVNDYFNQLEALPWSFQWSRLDYQVVDYPTAEVEFEIYTLSLDADYVGV